MNYFGQFPAIRFEDVSKASSNYQEWRAVVCHTTSALPAVPPLPANAATDCKATRDVTTSHLGGNVWETVFNLTNNPEVPKIDTPDKGLLSYELSSDYEAAAKLAVRATYFVLNASRVEFLTTPPVDPSGQGLELNSAEPTRHGKDWIYTLNFLEPESGELTDEGGDQASVDAGENQLLNPHVLAMPIDDATVAHLAGMDAAGGDVVYHVRSLYNAGRLKEITGNAYEIIPGRAPKPIGIAWSQVMKIVQIPAEINVNYVGLHLEQLSKVFTVPEKTKPDLPPDLTKPTDAPEGLIISFDTAVLPLQTLLDMVNEKYKWDWKPAGMQFEKVRGGLMKPHPTTGERVRWSCFSRQVNWDSMLVPKA